jgi:predicted dehydrogenase
MLRIALIGCGKIADQHVQAIGRVPGSQVVALCDREILMARQLGVRFGIQKAYDDVSIMLRDALPDAVHISTPPQSHFALARQCLEAGCHVYLEKPFTVTAPEADELIQLAEDRGRLLTAGHNYQFTPDMMRMRRLVRDGFLRGHPTHLESHWSYELGDAGYVGPMLGSRKHWVRQLPGQLLHNLISHGIAKLAEFLDDEILEVVARGHQSEKLGRLGGQEVLDELRVLIRDRKGATAIFCFSTQIRPGINQLRITGPGGTILADIMNGACVSLVGKSYKSYLTYLAPPLLAAGQYLRSFGRNVYGIFSWKLHQDFGMKELIQQFHEAIRCGGQPPIPYREILLTARLMDEIFAQIYPVKGES